MSETNVDLGNNFAFGTKAETLARLRGGLQTALLCDQYYFAESNWRDDKTHVLDTICELFTGLRIVVRSSAIQEDGADHSMAGAFQSVIGVSADDTKAVISAVEKVSESYLQYRPDNQFLIQPLVENVTLSGVATSRDIATGAPYFMINYDDFSGRTDSVTGGAKSKTIAVLRTGAQALQSPRIAAVVTAIQELEQVTGCDLLDVEFCTTRGGEFYVLQVRRMSMENQWNLSDVNSVYKVLDQVRVDLTSRMQAIDGLAGQSTTFGQMPDWNPAEMIGASPKPLAFSLYKTMITDHAWATARRSMGYKDIGNRPLMHSFAGRPFIDVRLSLNSFLPRGLKSSTEEAWLNYQLEKLSLNRDLHDKIEFGIAITCLDLNFESRRDDLRAAGLGDAEIAHFRSLLLELTNDFLVNGQSYFTKCIVLNRALDERWASSSKVLPFTAVRSVIGDCITDGIVPFSVLARHAFVAVSFLRSMVSRGLLTATESDAFFGSIRTVAYDLVHDQWLLSGRKLGKEEFMRRYGHLRPGTYDITSPRYDEMPPGYLSSSQTEPKHVEKFTLSPAASRAIGRCLEEEGYSVGPETLFEYMRQAIQFRELSKFLFTRTMSNIIKTISNWGETLGLDRDELTYLSFEEILSDRPTAALRARIAQAKNSYLVTQAIRLPHLIVEPNDVDVIRIPIGQPTYTTSATVLAPCALIDKLGSDVDHHIVLIESADPGYDWIFSHDIAGLITKFGGANSHMAIRCAEFGIPAAIGCGERLFAMALNSKIIELNCAAKTIRFPSSH
jgi:hypothetical protein